MLSGGSDADPLAFHAHWLLESFSPVHGIGGGGSKDTVQPKIINLWIRCTQEGLTVEPPKINLLERPEMAGPGISTKNTAKISARPEILELRVNTPKMIRGRVFRERIRIQAQKSELQAESRSYGPKVRVTVFRPPNPDRITQKRSPNGVKCFYRKPPLKPPWIHLTYWLCLGCLRSGGRKIHCPDIQACYKG